MSGVYWLVAVVILSILESVTYQLISVWFAIGAVGGMITAFLGANTIVQFGTATVITALCLIFTRPIVKKTLSHKVEKTNANSLIGQNAIVTETINNLKSTGQVKVNGMEWTARSTSDNIISEGSSVVIEKIQGVKLIVKQ